MKNKLKKTLAIMSFICVCCLFHSNVKALSKVDENGNLEYYVGEENFNCTNTFGDVFRPSSFDYNGIKISLYCEFKNPKETLEKFNKDYKEEILAMSKQSNLTYPITDDNYTEYKEQAELKKNGYSELLHFLRLYSLKDTNSDIIASLKLVNNYSINKLTAQISDDINSKLPVYSEKIQNITPGQNQIQATRKGLNVSKAVDYAYKYATSPNTGDYQYWSNADCTNFVSQILYAGGVSQIPGVTQSFGWWHVKALGKHAHSYSWTGANSFINYWGYNYGTNSFENLSKNVQKGDVILVDEDDDGQINHAGFVTAITSNNKTYTTSKKNKTINYKDFEITQHTTNYSAKVSAGAKGWIELMDQNADYFISRFH